jgi:hypothetical protein
MYRNNQIYGNAKALNQFARRSLNSPIWGEVQHSLDFKIEVLKTLRTPRVVKSFFTWRNKDSQIANSYFGEKWKFTPIGDPFLYQFVLEQPKLDLQNKTTVLIVPKYDRSQSQKDRLEKHLEVASQFGPQRGSEIEVSLHPGEINDVSTRRIYEDFGITLRKPKYFFDESFLVEEIRYLSRIGEVYTNYLGPTLLRAVFLGAKGNLLEGFTDQSGLISNHNVFRKRSSQTTELELVNELLGTNNMMSNEKLRSALSGNVNELLAAQLQKMKFFSEKKSFSILTSKRLKGIKVLCTNCIQLSAARLNGEKIICASCGYILNGTGDFYCVKCNLTRKISVLANHLMSGPNHSDIL